MKYETNELNSQVKDMGGIRGELLLRYMHIQMSDRHIHLSHRHIQMSHRHIHLSHRHIQLSHEHFQMSHKHSGIMLKWTHE